MRYRKGYKYQLQEEYLYHLDYNFPSCSSFEYANIRNNVLTVKKGYAWDGPSGLTIDTKSFMCGSLVHDALYQLIREAHISTAYKNKSDLQLHKICLKDGMNKIRAWYIFKAVQLFGRYSIINKKKEYCIK